MFSLQQNQRMRGQNRFCLEARGGVREKGRRIRGKGERCPQCIHI
jgi:hypothetical protein